MKQPEHTGDRELQNPSAKEQIFPESDTRNIISREHTFLEMQASSHENCLLIFPAELSLLDKWFPSHFQLLGLFTPILKMTWHLKDTWLPEGENTEKFITREIKVNSSVPTVTLEGRRVSKRSQQERSPGFRPQGCPRASKSLLTNSGTQLTRTRARYTTNKVLRNLQPNKWDRQASRMHQTALEIGGWC